MPKHIKILIVEDEAIIAIDLRDIIEEAGYSCIGITRNVDSSIEVLNNVNCDLILLDISLSGNSSGIELAKIVNEKYGLPFIIVSSHSDIHTSELVTSLNPVGYIVKPVQPQTLLMTIKIGFDNFSNRLSNMDSFIKEKYIYIKDSGRLVKLLYENILFAEAYDNYTYIITQEKKYLINSTLKKVEEKLRHHGFQRVHRSHMINVVHIDEIDDNYITIGKHNIAIGKTYKDQVKKWIYTL